MTVFPVSDRPDIEVEIDGTWYPGELRAWQQHADGWWANVSWHQDFGQTRLDTVPAAQVREI